MPTKSQKRTTKIFLKQLVNDWHAHAHATKKATIMNSSEGTQIDQTSQLFDLLTNLGERLIKNKLQQFTIFTACNSNDHDLVFTGS